MFIEQRWNMAADTFLCGDVRRLTLDQIDFFLCGLFQVNPTTLAWAYLVQLD